MFRLGLGINLNTPSSRGTQTLFYNPIALFSNGEEGAWYEPSTTTAFSDLEGFNLATYGQGVAHLVDKSKGATIEARRNRLRYTEQFNDGVWVKGSGTVSPNTSETTDPLGGNTADKLTHVSAINVYQVVSNPSGDMTFSAYLKKSGSQSTCELYIYEVGVGFVVSFEFNFDTESYSLAQGSGSATMQSVGGGWYRCSVTGTLPASVSCSHGVYNATEVYAWGAQLETGSTATAYQKITTGQTLSWLPGHHATQVTAGARPILARVPEGGRRNELSETDTFATQSVTVTAAQRTLSFTGTGTVTITGASTAGPLVGTGAGDRVSLTFTPSAGSLTLTVLGTVTDAQLELGASATTYQSVADSLGYDITEAGVTSISYLFDDEADDAISWTAPADTDYTIARVNTSGNVTILTGQSLSGATDILLEQDIAGYVAIDRALTSQETTDLTTYLEAIA